MDFSGVAYAWWNDRDDLPQYYWAGDNSSVHTCQCGIDGNCVQPPLTCNCDASLSYDFQDKGLNHFKFLIENSKII